MRWGALWALLLVGCAPAPLSSEPDAAAPVELGPLEPPPSEVSECAEGRVLSVAAWPGGGVQITLQPADEPPWLEVSKVPVETALAAVPDDEQGPVILALEPAADPSEHAARVARAAEVLDALPVGHRVALFHGDALAADLTPDRAHVAARLASLLPGAAGPVDEEALAGLLAAVEGPFGPPRRFVVRVGDEVWWAPDPEAPLQRLGACLDGPPSGAPLDLRFPSPCVVGAPAPMEHVAGLSCDPAAAATDSYPFGDTIHLGLTPLQRTIHDRRAAAKSKADFELTVALGDAAPIPATAHFRGQSSIDCQRKSLSVNLSGPEARRLGPGSADDELLLLSLCLDVGYFNQVLADRLLEPRGLFPLRSRFVEVRRNGASLGVYLLLEKPTEALRRDQLALAAVLRRRFDPEDKPEDVKWPPDPAGQAAALAAYDDLVGLVDAAPPGDLREALAARMDLDGYLTWLAFQTYFGNGDYVDELYLYASAEADGWYWRALGWDPDDLISACHHGGQHAFDDPHGILYCAEGDLERALLVSDEVYAGFVDALERLLVDELPLAAVEAALAGVRDDLFALLDDEETCAAMAELDHEHEGCVAARAEIQGHMDAFLAAVAERHGELLAQIGQYRGDR